MSDLREVELRIAVAEGILSREEAAALGDEAVQRRASPLALLVERGRLSAETFRSLRADALHDPTPVDGAASTLGSPPGERPPEAPRFPIAAWDRYTSVRFLGQGGMGRVFLAIDPKLRREVAIKFVHGDNPDHVRRLIAEARAQARVSHPHVCKVHEVGDVDGKVYIAMQFIAGAPLGSLAGELSVEQKVMVIRGAAEGLHEAHRAGIIHRDVKPSNIMVERSDGELRPYVMDFGLARQVLDDATLSGAVVGTPRYMAPEQLRGHGLDRRADVYSLGATLYHLLTGAPPIPGDTVVAVMHNLATEEPRPPRAIDPSIPVDLEAVVLKCLEKDRSARYDSARALADDLGRFLDGEPVRARPAGAWYRVRKRLAKHRRLAVAGALAIAALVVAVGWGLQARRDAGQRERLARRFTEMVEHVEAMARYSALSPRHDIRGDRVAIRARMDELRDEIARAGAAAAGPGHYALGRGYLALDDDAAARAELEAAWQHGFREPRAAYALALALGHLYRRDLRAAARIEQRDLREARRRDIERAYREPALGYLAASRGAEVPSAAYVAALAAFYRGDLDGALRALDGAAGPAWFYEAPALRGDVLFARALGLRDRGERDQARRDFDAGRAAYAAAAAVGESAPAIYASLGALEYAALVMELYGQGEVAPLFDRVVAATGHALAVLPDAADPLLLEARAHRSLAEHSANHGRDPEALLARALAAAERAVAAAPAPARLEVAQVYRQWGEARQGRNQDPSAELGKAVAASDAVAPGDRDAVYYGNLGLIFNIWADYQDQVGADAQANRGRAIDAYTRALAINRSLNLAWINLAINYYTRALQPRAASADGDLAQAIHALDEARAIDPQHVLPYFYGGQIHELRAQRARIRGGDAGPDLVRALELYRAGLAINPRLPHLHNGVGIALMDQARQAWERGRDPGPLLDEAHAAFEQAIAAAPDQGYGYDNAGEVLVQRAWLQRARGEDPGANVAAAVAVLGKAIERIPDHPTFWADLAMAHAIRAAHELASGGDPRPSLDQASAAVRTALARNPSDAQAQLYLGETRGLRARFEAQRGRPGDFAAAAQAFERAIELAPENPDYQLAFGQFCRAWAAHDAGDAPLARGLALADRVLAVHPDWPDALVLRAGVLVIKAQRATAERRAHAAAAAAAFTRALAINPALDKPWRAQLTRAQQLAAAR